MNYKSNLITYAEAYKILRSMQPELEPGPCGEFAEMMAWAAVKTGIWYVSGQLLDDLINEFESLKAEGIFNIQHG